MLVKESRHGRATGPAVHPDREGGILWILFGLEEPEERVDIIVLVLANAFQRTRREVDMASVRFHARCGLAEFRLHGVN